MADTFSRKERFCFVILCWMDTTGLLDVFVGAWILVMVGSLGSFPIILVVVCGSLHWSLGVLATALSVLSVVLLDYCDGSGWRRYQDWLRSGGAE